MADLEALLPAVKRKLNITWENGETEERLQDILAAAVPTMEHKLGTGPGFDFTGHPMAFQLLRDWCLYEWNHRSAEFSADYASEIEQVRAKLMLDGEEAESDGAEGV